MAIHRHVIMKKDSHRDQWSGFEFQEVQPNTELIHLEPGSGFHMLGVEQDNEATIKLEAEFLEGFILAVTR